MHTPTLQLVLCTIPAADAPELAKKLLQARLAACVNILPGVQSYYWWQGEITSGEEQLLLIKIPPKNASALEALILKHHPYDLPEILYVDVSGGLEAYLQWAINEASPRGTTPTETEAL